MTFREYKRELRQKGTIRESGMPPGTSYDEGHPLWELAQQHPNVDLFATERPEGIRLNMIRVAPENQRQGYAGAALKDLLAYADSQRLPTALTPGRPYRNQGMSEHALRVWYRDHGFVPNRGRNKNWAFTDAMIRPVQ